MVSPIYKDYNKIFLYANTGKEVQETLDFINKCDTEFGFNVVWLEAVIGPKGVGSKFKIVDYNTAKVNTDKDSPFNDLVKKFDIPNPAKKGHCTRDLKLVPMNKYLKSIGVNDYLEAVGIRSDESHRASNPNKYYPLVKYNIDEKTVRDFWSRQKFDLELKDYQGNCDLCFKKSKRKRLTIMRENPSWADDWIRWENESRNNYIFDRERIPMTELLRVSKVSGLFNPAIDKQDAGKFYPTLNLFDEISKLSGITISDMDMDSETDCFCKSGG